MESIFFEDKSLNFITNINQFTTKQKVLKSHFDIDTDTKYPMRIPKQFVDNMEKLNDEDFLRVMFQFVPVELENKKTPEELTDPLSESKFEVYPRVLKKYSGRVLVNLTNDCFCNCRFCFRRHTRVNNCHSDFFSKNNYLKWIDGMIGYINQDTSIKEVILSGGDPLILSDEILGCILEKLCTVNNLLSIRVHTRSLCVYPDRLTLRLEKIIYESASKKNLIFVFHVNHVRECNLQMKKLAEKILCYSQTVLLKGVNDKTQILSDLFYKLISYKITPYYLHSLDPVSGGMHFKVDQSRGKQIMDELRRVHPGYMIPRYAVEEVDAPYKTIIC